MERAIDPLLTIDAKLWADEFMATKQRLGDAEFDHAMMLGWFANAIMRGYDAGRDSMTPTPSHPDAQATIAALQARVKELEAIKIPDDAFTYCAYCGEKSPVDEHNEDLSAHIKVCPKHPMRDVESQLTQRTAELEAAKHCYADLLAKYQNLVAWYDKQNGTPCEQVRHKQEVADLQAELERVRGLIAEYAKAKTDFDEKRLQEDHYAGKERYNRLVEAENALLQHRQGLEG